DVFLIPQTVYEHHGNLERLLREDFIDGLILPVRVVIGMLENLAPETDLFETTPAPELTCGAGFHKHVVVVEVTGPPLDLVGARCLLIVDVAHALLAKRAVVE